MELKELKVTLRPDEVAVSHIIGRNRALIAREAGVVDAKIGGQDGAEADVIGFMAEYAVAKLLNTFPDIGLSPRSGSADGRFRGVNYDVKATKYKSGKLLCTLKDNPDVALYILAIVDEPHVTIAGYSTKENLRQKENIKNLGHGDGYSLEQGQLLQFSTSKLEFLRLKGVRY